MRGRRICIVTTGLALGGAEMQVLLLAKALRASGWRVEISSLLPPAAFEQELAAADIPVRCLGMKKGIPDPRAVLRLASHLRSFRPHVVHCHMVHANLLGRVTRLIVPRTHVLISTAHSIWEGARWRDWAYRCTDFLCDLTTNVSSAGLDRYTAERICRKDKSAWVPNGIDISGFDPSRSARDSVRAVMEWNSFVWLAVGNLREPKDYPTMLRAIAALRPRFPDCVLAIAGSGPLNAELASLCAQLGIGGNIQFLGARTDIPNLLQAADGFVMSSAWEGTPMALLEASAACLPVAVTRVGGNPEVVEHGKTGLLVSPHSSEELGAAMSSIMNLAPAIREKMGRAARARVESIYGLGRVLAQWENIYEHLLQEKQHALPPRGLKAYFWQGKGSAWK